MAENKSTKVTGVFHSYMTPSGYTQRAEVECVECDLNVPPAADSMIGQCEYYYRPLHCGYTEMVKKVTLGSASEAVVYTAVKLFSFTFDPWSEGEVVERLLKRREELIPPNCTDSDWSRHSNFMMRHIGCGHKPPSYYIGYGYYYCSQFGAELFPKLSRAGQAWLRDARWRLQKNMEEGLKQNMQGDVIELSSEKPGNGSFTMEVKRYQLELEDNTFKKFAFKTHPLAYLDAGIAYLPALDLWNILRQPNLGEWGSWDTYAQAFKTGAGTAKTWLGNRVQTPSAERDDLVDRSLHFLAER